MSVRKLSGSTVGSRYWSYVPTNRTSEAQCLFRHVRRLQKCLGPRRHSPKKRALQRLEDGPLRLGDAGRGGLYRLPTEPGTHPTRSVYRPRRPTEMCPNPRASPENSAYAPLCWGESRYSSYVPPTRRMWHKTFFRWVRVQGRSPDMSGASKNASGPVGIPL